jgi:hypothetical protein
MGKSISHLGSYHHRVSAGDNALQAMKLTSHITLAIKCHKLEAALANIPKL